MRIRSPTHPSVSGLVHPRRGPCFCSDWGQRGEIAARLPTTPLQVSVVELNELRGRVLERGLLPYLGGVQSLLPEF